MYGEQMQRAQTLSTGTYAITRLGLMQIAFGVALLFACSQIEIPFKPVPITLQTMGVMLIGLTFTRRNASAAVLSYLALGALGAPVFAGFSGGIPTLLSTTGGYLMGFWFAVLAMTSLKARLPRNSIVATATNAALGTGIVFFFGLAWLSRFIGFEAAIQFGLLPFIIPGIVKIALLTLSLRAIKPDAL